MSEQDSKTIVNFQNASMKGLMYLEDTINSAGDILMEYTENTTNEHKNPTGQQVIESAIIGIKSQNKSGKITIRATPAHTMPSNDQQNVNHTTEPQIGASNIPRTPDVERDAAPFSPPILQRMDNKFTEIGIEPDLSCLAPSVQTPGNVSFSVSGQVFHTTRIHLTAKSSVFRELFQKAPAYRYKITNNNQIDPVVFEAMLNFLRNKNQLDQLNQRQMENLLQVAHKFDLQTLKSTCEQALIVTKCANNAFDLLILAQACKADRLKESLLNFIANQCPLISQSDAYMELSGSDRTLFKEVNGRIIGANNR